MKHTLALLLLASALTASCTSPKKSAGEALDDTVVHSMVKTRLVGYGVDNINIEVYRGVVQLAGFLASDANRDAAVNRTATTKGVKRVINQLHVEPTRRTAGRTLDDGVLAGKVKAALADNKVTSALDINVEVRHGVVLLSGFVNNDREREIAVDVAEDQPGVVKVLNGMDIKPSA